MAFLLCLGFLFCCFAYLFFVLFVWLFVFLRGWGWFGWPIKKKKRQDENLNLFVFRLFMVCNTRRFAQTFPRARHATGLYSSMQSYCE